MDRQIGPYFKIWIPGSIDRQMFRIFQFEFRDPWIVKLVRILKLRCRDPWIAKLVRILKLRCRDPWTAKLFRILKLGFKDPWTAKLNEQILMTSLLRNFSYWELKRNSLNLPNTVTKNWNENNAEIRILAYVAKEGFQNGYFYWNDLWIIISYESKINYLKTC